MNNTAGTEVVVLPVKLDNSVIGRYLSLQDNEFVDCVVSDIKQFLNRSRKGKSVLLFPPVNNYRRFLIHKVSEKYPEELCTFSIGQGHGRRTVVCFKRDLLRDLHQTRATDQPVSGSLQPVKRFGAMGVERQQLADQAAGTPSLDNSVKRARAVPPLGIYRPPAARRSEQIAPPPSPRSSSPAAETKPERTRPSRQRRPDIQVYVPRPKRLSAEGQETVPSSTTCTSSNKKSSSLNLRTQQNLQLNTFTTPPQKSNSLPPDKECKLKVAEVELHTILPSSDYWFAASSCRQFCGENDEVSDWTKSTDQPAESNYHPAVFGSKMNDKEIGVGEGGVTTHQLCAENVQSVQGKKGVREMDNFQIGIEGVGIGRRNMHRDADNSASGQSVDNTPSSLNSKEQVLDYNNIKNGDRILKNAQFHSSSNCQETKSESVTDKQEFNSTEPVYCEGSGSVNFTDKFLDEVTVGRGLEHRSSTSFSSDSIAEYSSHYRPSSVTDNGIQARDYYSEIKNARNSSEDKISGCEMDIQNPCNSITEDSGFVSTGSDVSLNCDKTHSIITSHDDTDRFLTCSDTVRENTLRHCDDSCASNLLGVTNLSNSIGSTKHVEASEDRLCSKNICVTDNCHKKDENNECQVQEEQNRKNRRIIRGNFMSDVLIISDPDPVTEVMAPSAQIDCSSENMSLLDSVLNEEKSLQLKGESVIVDTSGPDVKEQSCEKHKSSSSSNLLPVNLNPDECTWDTLFDDNGECLDPKLMEELTNAVGSVTVEKPQSDYRSYQNRVELMMSGAGDDEFSHVIEIYNFPSEFKTNDLCAVFSPYMKGGFEIKWVDDTHALGVFSSSLVAAEVLAADHPFVKTRPLHEATPESRMKARRSAEFLQPYRARPETCVALARRLVGGALGVRLNTTREEREAERKLLKEAREKKKLAARQRDEAWEGTLGEN